MLTVAGSVTALPSALTVTSGADAKDMVSVCNGAAADLIRAYDGADWYGAVAA